MAAPPSLFSFLDERSTRTQLIEMIRFADEQLAEIRDSSAALSARIAHDASRGVETRDAVAALNQLDRLLLEGEERRAILAASLQERAPDRR